MDGEKEKAIKEIIGEMECPKGFKCANSGFEDLCKAQDFGLENYLLCLEDDPSDCTFALPFYGSFFCQCPLRVYIAKKVKK